MRKTKKRLSRRRLFALVICVVVLAGFLASKHYKPAQQPLPLFTGKLNLSIPDSLTLRDKIGQLLVVGVRDKNTARDLEQKYQIGGFLLLSNSNLTTRNAISSIGQSGKIAPLFVVDEEGGQVARLWDNKYSKDTAQYMGTLPDAQVEKIANQMGQKMKAIGLDVDLAPVTDLNNGTNTSISIPHRSFSDNPAVVTQKSQAFAVGLRQAGIVPTFKHFPGLGNAVGATGGDTDTGTAIAPTIANLKLNDLTPYKALLHNNLTTAVMMGNQIVPGLTDGLPASLSSEAYNLLRTQYGFKQVIFTDDLLEAGSIINTGNTPSEAVISAIQAGADMPLLQPGSEQEIDAIITGVQQAVKDGQLQEAQIDTSLTRVLYLKTTLGHL